MKRPGLKIKVVGHTEYKLLATNDDFSLIFKIVQ